ncbi:N-formylglutamate amidohydrolase [Ventosimonas gracilis]|uniref:N-formylglutamate amidohydrolase n=1 Tax=Ventosimonas gracilis TaxID=1680762 RepID=A0A139SWH4_9GAMM|nr:N-formylglutamate amidohydrolase [Ventosimonas gracilis]KXU38772.1 N-formylglutamate amidohydrolase [Ventosimonas gracilis]
MPSSTENTELGLYTRAPFTLHLEQGRSPVVLVCEHASAFIPPELNRLGLSEAAAKEHIAWDIGALKLALALSEQLDAPLLAAEYSRLLIDLNRPLNAPDSIPEQSEIYSIAGNQKLSEQTRRYREDCLYRPFQQQLARLIEQRLTSGHPVRLVAVHSFTPVYRGNARPWPIGILFGHAQTYAQRLINGLRQYPINIGINQPYQITDDGDMTIPVHGDAQHIDAVLLELRNDGLRSEQDIKTWAKRLAPLL